ncbi:DUF2993 domain-containing protein [Streptomyces sp. NBC_01565]|uniref:LmeA family phospholipid-binding protein n=1 Tax=unclassified Streptomyces TaxID=2593676 RepID=UPI0022528087|nr:DUF2993 domain-containing protein [Streptomyces sp. NBC_01565]MCX4545491.1 DUF2993 domain-containing protein [Streptomyces sp. NBC_01565]
MNRTARAEAASAADRQPTSLPRPRRRRARLWTVAGACALVAVAALTDTVAAALAEGDLADRVVRRQSALVESPDVSIEGLPFLLHAARGTFPEVDVRAKAATEEGLPVTASVDLRNVSKAKGNYRAATARADFSVPLDALAAKRGPDVRLSESGGRLEISRAVLGLPLVVTTEVRLSGDTVTLEPTAATIAGRPLDPANPRIAAAVKDAEREIPALPLGLEPSGISVADGAVTVHARADDVALDQA